MVRDLNFGVKIVGMETVREKDGLALSSRNRYLSASERAQAPVLRRALREAASFAATRRLAPEALGRKLIETVRRTIGSAPLARIDYVSAVDAENLGQPHARTKRLLVAVAVYFGTTRLIDNLEIRAQ